MLRLFLFLFFLLPAHLFAQQENSVRIGLYAGRGLTSAEVQVQRGSYEIESNGKTLGRIGNNDKVSFRVSGTRVQLILGKKDLGHHQRVVLKRLDNESRFRLKMISGSNSVKHSVYPDNLIVRIARGKLVLTNECELEHYVAGVTEAESGKGHEVEFYKVQASIARTYALSNLRRHAVDGFHLCDEVHCQAYHGAARFEPAIDSAVLATKDQVLVDADIRLITAAFHSNCGGHTMNSEHVWSRALPYLTGRLDSFCLVMPHSHWEHSVPRKAWSDYLQKNDAWPLDSLNDLAFYPTSRQRFFADSLKQLKMTQVRSDFRLRSAFFVVEEGQDSIRFTGRGFGHGVGLCQEGAMRMASLGYTCREIVHFYYRDVHIINRRNIPFFDD